MKLYREPVMVEFRQVDVYENGLARGLLKFTVGRPGPFPRYPEEDIGFS